MDAVWGAINIGEGAGWPSQLRSLGLWMLAVWGAINIGGAGQVSLGVWDYGCCLGCHQYR